MRMPRSDLSVPAEFSQGRSIRAALTTSTQSGATKSLQLLVNCTSRPGLWLFCIGPKQLGITNRSGLGTQAALPAISCSPSDRRSSGGLGVHLPQRQCSPLAEGSVLPKPAYILVQHPARKPAWVHGKGPYLELQPEAPKSASSSTSQPVSEITGCCKEVFLWFAFPYYRREQPTDVLTCLLSFPLPLPTALPASTPYWGETQQLLQETCPMLIAGLGNNHYIFIHHSEGPVDMRSAPISLSCHPSQFKIPPVLVAKVRSGFDLTEEGQQQD